MNRQILTSQPYRERERLEYGRGGANDLHMLSE